VNTPPVGGTPTVFAIYNPALPPSIVGFPYEPTLRTSGGSGARETWSLVSGALPPGVRLNNDGTFSGTPTAAGAYPITVKVTAGSETLQKALTIPIVTQDVGRFNLTRFDVAPVPSSLEPHLKAALARWEKIITGDLHIDTIPAGFYSRPSDCGGFGRAAEGAFIDDVFLILNIAPLATNVLGQATVCGVRYDNELPAIGILTLDPKYVERLAGTETLTDVIFHEIGHTLGYGVLWDDLLPATTCLSEESIGDPTFLGLLATKQWQDAGRAGNPPLETEGGFGTACSHWRESTFDAEVMSGYVEAPGIPQPVSRFTLASMADLGYTVDMRQADSYTLPPVAPSLRVEPWPEHSWLGDDWEVVQAEPLRTLRGTALRGRK
jgi:hypothetical protein